MLEHTTLLLVSLAETMCMLVALTALSLLAVQVSDYGDLTKLLAGHYLPSVQAHLQQAALLDWSVQSPRSVPSGQVGCLFQGIFAGTALILQWLIQ